MKNKTALFAKALIAALPLSMVAGLALAQVPAPPPPPDTYVATVEPTYYNGQPVYWYQDHWYWRDANNNWQYYAQEPQFLHDHRMHGPPDRHMDEHRGDHRGDDHRGGRR